MAQYPANRNKELAAIHTAKRDLGMDDDAYRDILWSVARVRSAKDLDHAGRMKVLDHFKACGWKPTPKPNQWAFIDKAAADRKPLLRKICMVCKSMGVGKEYAEGAALRQSGVERKLEMMDQGQLWMLAGVLERTRKHKAQSKTETPPNLPLSGEATTTSPDKGRPGGV